MAHHFSHSLYILGLKHTLKLVEFTDDKACKVIVDNDQLSLAIGKEGQNARLAARLTGMKIDIKAE